MQNSISVGADWNDTLYYFSNNADTGKVYHVYYNVPGNRAIGIFATDLISGLYNIKVNGTTIQTISTDENGVLQSSAILKAGNHKIEIMLNTTKLNEHNIKHLLTIFPNPTHSELNIVLPAPSFPYEINICDTNGKLVMRNNNQTRLNISSLSSGQYYIQLKQDKKYYSANFIKE